MKQVLLILLLLPMGVWGQSSIYSWERCEDKCSHYKCNLAEIDSVYIGDRYDSCKHLIIGASLTYEDVHKDCPHYWAEKNGYKYNLANCLVEAWVKPTKDSFPHTFVPDSVYQQPSLPMKTELLLPTKVDTIAVDTVGFEKTKKQEYHNGKIRKSCYEPNLMNPTDDEWKIEAGCSYEHHWLMRYIWQPTFEYTTDTSYYLTEEQRMWLECVLMYMKPIVSCGDIDTASLNRIEECKDKTMNKINDDLNDSWVSFTDVKTGKPVFMRYWDIKQINIKDSNSVIITEKSQFIVTESTEYIKKIRDKKDKATEQRLNLNK